MHARDRLHILFHNGLQDESMGAGPGERGRGAGGPSLTRLLECIRMTTQRLEIAGAAITAYDPAFDPDGRAMRAARAAAHEIARGIRFQPTSGTG
ncbi:MAG: hypothetical protein ACTHMY_06300 [Solirubrobacteraceae bacterium]